MGLLQLLQSGTRALYMAYYYYYYYMVGCRKT